MNEALVEWTLLREHNYLDKCLGLGIKKKIFQQYCWFWHFCFI